MTFETITPSGAIIALPPSVCPAEIPISTSGNSKAGSSRPNNAVAVLVINDMQPQFKATNNSDLLASVAAEIKQTIAAGGAIVVVEYDPLFEGKTHQCLLDLLADYEHVAFATKHLDRVQQRLMRGESNLPHNADDGSEQIIDVCLDHQFSLEHFRFCGVNTDICVLKTVRGLRQKIDDCKLELALAACASENGLSPKVMREFNQLHCNVA
jgi:hypothetical protein